MYRDTLTHSTLPTCTRSGAAKSTPTVNGTGPPHSIPPWSAAKNGLGACWLGTANINNIYNICKNLLVMGFWSSRFHHTNKALCGSWLSGSWPVSTDITDHDNCKDLHVIYWWTAFSTSPCCWWESYVYIYVICICISIYIHYHMHM